MSVLTLPARQKILGQVHSSLPPAEKVREEKAIEPKIEAKQNFSKGQIFKQAFVDSKEKRDGLSHWLNIANIFGNAMMFLTEVASKFGFKNKLVNKISQNLANICTKVFFVSTALLTIVECLLSGNYLAAQGYFNDILIACSVKQDDTYVARGTASGTYNLANALCIAQNKHEFKNPTEHFKSMGQGLVAFVKNLFSKNCVQNFGDSKNAMFATFGGLGANLGAISWLLGFNPAIASFVRDVCGILMDVEQLNPGHLKSGKQNYFWSGVNLAIGTVCDYLQRIVPSYKSLFVPLTFIFDGIGRNLLRLHQNEHSLDKKLATGVT